jgi:hypothetical protein
MVSYIGKPNYSSGPNDGDLATLKELIEAGKITPVIDMTYSLSETPEAIRYLEEGHTRGKVVITTSAEGARCVTGQSTLSGKWRRQAGCFRATASFRNGLFKPNASEKWQNFRRQRERVASAIMCLAGRMRRAAARGIVQPAGSPAPRAQ